MTCSISSLFIVNFVNHKKIPTIYWSIGPKGVEFVLKSEVNISKNNLNVQNIIMKLIAHFEGKKIICLVNSDCH